jgi:transcription antitermination factor NusG
MTTEKNWYAVYTKSHYEKKVAELLNKKSIETYCPLNRVHKQWKDRKKIILVPLFTSYVFVNINTTEQLEVVKTNGILNFVYWLNKPAVIRNEEINAMKSFLGDYKNIQLEKIPLKINDRVRVIGGPLMEQEGLVLSIKNKSVKIALPSLGYMMFAHIDSSDIEIIDTEIRSLNKIDSLNMASK